MPIPPREIYAVAGDVFVSHHITETFFGKCWLCKASTQMRSAIQTARSRYSSHPVFPVDDADRKKADQFILNAVAVFQWRGRHTGTAADTR